MKGSIYQIRRASADDLPRLTVLWTHNSLPAAELEKRFTEFQLIESPEGQLTGAIGLRVVDRQGLVHSEAFLDFGLADTLRPMVWERIKNVARAHGLYRLWTMETAPYWRQEGFSAADDEVIRKLPESFGPIQNRWLGIKLRDEVVLDEFLAKELGAFKKAEREHNDRLLQQARMLKGMATLIAVAAFILVMFGLYYLFKRQAFSQP